MKNTFKTIKTEYKDNILKVILNRPEKRNALNEQMTQELTEVFKNQVDTPDILGICLTGEGKAFCAGADLDYLHSLISKSEEENLEDSINLKNMYLAIYTCPKPTVALVNGPAIAGGCGLVTVTDAAFASENATFGYPEVKIGFVASIVSFFLVNIVGLRQAKNLLLTGKIINAKEAKKIGLVTEVGLKSQYTKLSDEYFNTVRKNSPVSMEQTKDLFRLIEGDKTHILMEELCHYNMISRKTSDFKEGILSFLEKRKPNWE